jgi:hypothetical protein
MNMAGLGVKYEVRHNPATGRWNVLRGGKPTGAFGRDQHTAIAPPLGMPAWKHERATCK